MSVLVLVEQTDNALADATLATLTAASKLGEVVALVAGNDCEAVAKTVASFPEVSAVLLAEHAGYQAGLAENIAPLVAREARAQKCTHVLAPASTFGKNCMPRVAALLDTAQLSDITAIIDAKTVERPIYAGNAIATVHCEAICPVLTVRPTAFVDATPSSSHSATLSVIEPGPISAAVSYLGCKQSESIRPELTSAKVVVSGGRALGSAENFSLIEALADKLGAAIGASRAAVDAGFVPNDYQVGQTGKIVAPDLYIAVGISGAIQHVAGIKDSKVIVAINNDESAPIFDIADFGLVGDLFEVLPEFTKLLA